MAESAKPPKTPPFKCRFCGAPSWYAPEDQTAPPSYCHESDHGDPDNYDDEGEHDDQ